MSTSAPRSVAQYLDQLRREMAGDDPALLQDALYDAEEYLRAVVAQNPDRSEADVLEAIAITYGAPAEVAAAYRTTEAQVSAALATPPPRVRQSALGRFFGIYRDTRSYAALLYMLLSLVTGIFYFTFTVTGLSLSVGLAVLIIGLPLFLLFLGATRALSLAEGRLVESLLGVRMPRRPAHAPNRPGAEGWISKITLMLKDPRTWGTLLYLLLMLPLGIVYFTLAVTGLATAVSVVAAPFAEIAWQAGWLDSGFSPSFPGDQLPLLIALPLLLAFGILLLTLLLHLAAALGRLHGRLAKSLLVARAQPAD
jgi:uncharacterized membrane protein